MNTNFEMIPCIKCNAPMPKLRLDKYGYKNCINCSTEKPLLARTVTYGTGEEIWTDVEIITQDQANRILELEAQAAGRKAVPLEILDFDTVEAELSSSATPIINRLINDEEMDDQSQYVYDADYDDVEEEEEEEDDIADD